MSYSEQTPIGVLEQIAKSLGALDDIAEALAGGVGSVGGGGGGGGVVTPVRKLGIAAAGVEQARSDPGEMLTTNYSVGRGTVRPDGRGISYNYELYGAEGQRIGTKVIVGEIRTESVDELRAPSFVRVKFGDTDSVPDVGPTTLIKAKYTFDNGSSITAIGKGTSQLFTLANGRAVLADAAVMAVAGGTGEYEGARGIVSTIGFVAADAGKGIPLGQPGLEVTQKTVDVFRVFKGSEVKR